MDANGELGGAVCGKNWEIGINTHTLLIICTKLITNENAMYSTGNSIHCAMVTYIGRKSETGDACRCLNGLPSWLRV